MKKCGYSFWGYLGDIKYDKNGNVASTPDGNAFYSWCIIRELQKRGYEVTQIMPDRDKKGFELHDGFLFASWLQQERTKAYVGTKKSDWRYIIDKHINFAKLHKLNKKSLVEHIKRRILDNMYLLYGDIEFILHEFRMLIPGRNDYDSIFEESWQPDYLIQECVFDYCIGTNKRLILFDLDYKLDLRAYKSLRKLGCNVSVIELGTRWQRYAELDNTVAARKVYIPFDFENIGYFELPEKKVRKQNLVYVGNRYERDWCIDEYIPEDMRNCIVYGNWLEGGRDSQKIWKNITFGKRLQTFDMSSVYQSSVATILLAKREYCEYGFMTARIIESIFYGTVPLFIEEYGEDVIKEYAGDYAGYLTVSDKEDVKMRISELRTKSDGAWINIIIEYLRDHLKFMDVKNFVDVLLEVK